MRFPKGATEEFKRWWRRWCSHVRPNTGAKLPTYYTSAPDFVRQFDMLNHLKPCAYTWDPSPITSATAPEIRERLNTVHHFTEES